MTKNILIVEDNEIHMKVMEELLSNIENIKIFKAYNMEQACYMLSLNNYSLFIVDIILDAKKSGDVSGISFVELVRGQDKYGFTPIIFTTSLEDPKLCAYSDLHCYQYIEKPFDADYVAMVVNEALKYPTVNSNKEHGYFRKDGILYSVKVADIIFISIRKPRIMIHTVKDCLLLGYYSAAEVLQELRSEKMIQCNRNTIINRDYIEYIDFTSSYIKLKGIDEKIEIGIVMKKNLKEKLRDYE